MKTIDRDKLTDYQRGYIDGLTAYAWWKDGTQWVGTCGQTLEAAVDLFLNRKDAENSNE